MEAAKSFPQNSRYKNTNPISILPLVIHKIILSYLPRYERLDASMTIMGAILDKEVKFGVTVGTESIQALIDEGYFHPGLRLEKLELNVYGESINLLMQITKLEALNQLKELVLNQATLISSEIKMLTSLFPKLEALTSLKLTNNKMASSEFKVLTEKIHELPNLTSLTIHCNQIGDDGASALAAALPLNPKLKLLDLKFSGIQNPNSNRHNLPITRRTQRWPSQPTGLIQLYGAVKKMGVTLLT